MATFGAVLLLGSPTALAQQEAARTAERRVALIVGNSNYRAANRLKNPVADAAEMQIALQRMGFELIVGQDLSLESFKEKVREFTRAIRNADIALLFYAGHGVQYGDQNYLLPTDIELKSEAEVTSKSIALDGLLETMGRLARASVVFLDACRDSPKFTPQARGGLLPRLQFASGLAGVNAPPANRFVGYAAAPGLTAEDGRGKNSPFTEALVRHVQRSDDINTMFTAVRVDVLRSTSNRQRPESRDSLSTVLYLKGGNSAPPEFQDAPPPLPQDEKPPAISLSRDAEVWMAIKDTADPSNFEDYLRQFPDGRFVNLARRRLDQLRLPPKGPDARPRPPVAALPEPPVSDGDLVTVMASARITKDHPREEAQRSARTLARARAIAAKVHSAGPGLPAAISSTAEAVELLGYMGRGILQDETWTTHPAASGEVKVELRARVRPLVAAGERKLSGNLESTDIIAGQPIRLKVMARKDAQIGIFAWQADGTVLRLYPESTRGQAVLIRTGESVWFPRANDPYPAISSANMPGERSNHEALVVVTGGRATTSQFEVLVPATITKSTQHAGTIQLDASEFLNRLATIPDPELELLVLPYEVRAAQ